VSTPVFLGIELPCVLLTIRVTDNAYSDDDDTYVYPARYRAALTPLEAGQPMLALIYEPRHGGGRMGYVAWALLSTPPQPIGKGQGGQQEWRVRYDGGLIPFPRAVAQEKTGTSLRRCCAACRVNCGARRSGECPCAP